MASDNTSRPARAHAFRFFLVWLFAGGLMGVVTFLMFLVAGIGGIASPPGAWLIFWSLGTFVLPVLLAVGGLPAAIRIARGEAWKRTARITLAVCATSWVVLASIVFLGPSIFGWSW